ncbi:MAG: hypothetical protein VYC65_05195 [Chloroflexota bacterium]|nr:hypothetical protein [Chloroflexota bacterium]
MNKKFIVDVRIAASERDSLFVPEWNWPIKQETYDDPFREFVEWTHAFPTQFADKPEMRIAFELIERVLIHDLSYFVGVWIDVSTAKKLDLDLVHGSDQQLYKMLLQDRCVGFSPYADGHPLKSTDRPAKRLYQLARRTVRNSSAKIKGRPTIHSIGVNPLLLELTGGPCNLFHLSYAGIAAQRPTIQHPNSIIGELAEEIQQQLSRRLADVDHAPTEKLNSHIRQLISNHLINGWSDKDFKPEFTPTPKMTLFTGTGGGYISRTLSHAFQKNGAKVVRATHGGDSVLFNNPLWASTEISFANTYVTFGTKAAEITQGKVARHKSIRRLQRVPSTIAAGSIFHQRIVDRSFANDEVKTVYVLSASFTGSRRHIPNIKIHDVVLLDWNRRLIQMIKAAGFQTIVKRHPKGLGPNIPIYEDIASKELKRMGMVDTFDHADAYVIDMVGTAFMEAMCTLKPVILIEIPNRQLTKDARTQLNKSIVIIRATYDENNRVTIERDRLIEGLSEPVNLEARHKFISDYLTSSDDIRNKCDLFRKTEF